jgi:hypothetical protein
MNRFDIALGTQAAKEGRFDWLTPYREAAALTRGILPTDHRYRPILAALEAMDRAYESRDVAPFLAAAAQLSTIVRDAPEPVVSHEQAGLPLGDVWKRITT